MESSNNYFQMMLELRKHIDWLNQILKGDINDTITIDGVNKPSISKDIEDHYSAIMAAMEGKVAYPTKTALVASGAPASDKPLAEVWNDPVLANNGLYGYLEGQWVKSPYDMQQFYRQTATYFEGVAGGVSVRDSNPNLHSDFNHEQSDVFWSWALPTEIVNGRKCLVFGGGSTSFSIYSRSYPVDQFPSGKVSASLKIEKLGSNKGGYYDRILLIQYSSTSPSSVYEVSREEFSYRDSDMGGSGIYISFDDVSIHPETKSINIYVEANTWDAYISEVCICDGPSANYRLPSNAYLRKQLLPKGTINLDFADFTANVDSWSFKDDYLNLNAKANVLAYATFETPAVGELSPGSELFLDAEMRSAKTNGVDVSLFQYNEAGAEVGRNDLIYTGTNNSWQRKKSPVFIVAPDAHRIVFRVVNRSLMTESGSEQAISGEFRNVFLQSAKQSTTIIDPHNVLMAAFEKTRAVEKKVDAVIETNPNNVTVDNLIRDPINFSGFKLSLSRPIHLNGNTHILLNPAASFDTTASVDVPYHYFKSEKISAGVTLSRKKADSSNGRVLLIQRDSAGFEVARKEHKFSTSLKVDEYDQDSWVRLVFSGVDLLPETHRVSLYLDSGVGHQNGFFFSSPWIVDGESKVNPSIRDYPNYWFDPDWKGTNISSTPSDQYGFTHRDQDGFMLVMQGDDNAVYARRYWTDAVGVFTPQKSGFFECSMFASNIDGRLHGAEMGILFFDEHDTEIGRFILPSTVTDKFKREGMFYTVPINAKRVQIRFVRWGENSKDVRFRDVSITDARSGSIARSFYVASVLSASSSSGSSRTVYVSHDGNDTNNGSSTNPFKTLNKAVSELQGVGTVIVEDGWYDGERLSIPRDSNLIIRPNGMARPKFIQGDKYEGTWTKTVGLSNVWQLNTQLAPNRYMFEHLTPEGLIDENDRLPLQRGRTHRLPSFRLKRFNSLEELDSGTSGGWLFDSGAEILYITTPNRDDPNQHVYYRPNLALINGGHPTSHLEISGLESWYGPIDFRNIGSYLAKDVRVIGSRANGIRRDGARGVEYHIEASAADNDGTNTHNSNSDIIGLPDGDVPPAAYVASFDMWCHDNFDDGDSLHERCEGDFHGGLWEWNGDRGVATAYGAHVNVYNGIARDNGNNGQSSGNRTVSGEGFSSVGSAVDEEGGVGTQMTCFSCESYRNNVNYNAYGSGCTLIVNQSISRDARVAGYCATHSGLLIAKNCYESGSAAAKLEEVSGRIIIKNAEVLT